MEDTPTVVCPYCLESVELYVDPDTAGSFVEDCAVCCRPWQVRAERDHEGQLSVHVSRAQ
ncbi:MAG: CPXCG motif-containing cysteine-rich protein [Deltaproteobacteria bacterium]|nr:CPXCG motif-containing cysteine-rich protein [Deltaproteobacteria bacterium]